MTSAKTSGGFELVSQFGPSPRGRGVGVGNKMPNNPIYTPTRDTQQIYNWYTNINTKWYKKITQVVPSINIRIHLPNTYSSKQHKHTTILIWNPPNDAESMYIYISITKAKTYCLIHIGGDVQVLPGSRIWVTQQGNTWVLASFGPKPKSSNMTPKRLKISPPQ